MSEEAVIQMETNLLGQEVPVDRFEKFRRGKAYYAFVEQGAEFLDVEVPEGAKWGSVPTGETDEEGEPITRQKTVREFVLTTKESLDGTSAVISCGAMERPVLRQKPVSRNDMADWEYFLSFFGITLDDLLTIKEYQALITSEKYLEQTDGRID